MLSVPGVLNEYEVMNTESELKIPDQSIHMAAYKIRLMLFHIRKEYLDEPGNRALEDIFAVMPGPKRQRTSDHAFLDFRPPSQVRASAASTSSASAAAFVPKAAPASLEGDSCCRGGLGSGRGAAPPRGGSG